MLRNFLTIDVLDRFQRATAGFFHVAALSEHDITRDSQSVFYLVYVEIAAAYLKEVLDLMPEYTKASGQGEQRDPVNIQGMFLGPVGNVGGSVTGSSVTVGEQVTVNGATVATTATVDSQVALKLIDLAAAIQSDPGVDADDRPDLLIDVQDIAHAEAAPEDRDRFRRAKRALMAITAAASTAQQVEGVLLEGHDVFSKYR